MTYPSVRKTSFRFVVQAFWLVAAIAWTTLVLDLAVQPAGKTGWLMKLLGGDKVVHALAFVVGEIVWVKSIETVARLRRWGAVLVGTLIALAVGAAIEIWQRYVPTRSSDIKDFLADVVGCLVALALLSLYAAWHSARASVPLDSQGITK